MAQTDNPLVPVAEKVVRIDLCLTAFLRTVLRKIKPMMQGLLKFLTEVRKAAKDLAGKIGKTAITKVLKLGDNLLRLLPVLEKQVIEGIKLARKILAVVRKAKDPAAVFKAVKAMVARVAKLFRVVVTKLAELMAVISPIEAVLSLIGTMKMVLQFMFKWIADVTGVSSGVKKAKAVLKKAQKILRDEAKQVTQLVKEVNKLKPA